MTIGLLSALIGGVLTLLSPCSVTLLPAFFAYAFGTFTSIVLRTGIFTLGLLTTLIPMGVFASAAGSLLAEHRHGFVVVAACVVIALGLVQLLGVRVPGLSSSSTAAGASGLSVYLLGTVYGIAGTCSGPILGAVLTVAALGGNATYGAALLTAYGVGMVVPLIVLALLWGAFGTRLVQWTKPRGLRIRRWSNTWVGIIGGALAISLGVVLLVTGGEFDGAGLLSASTQVAAESDVIQATGSVGNGIVLAAAAVLALGLLATQAAVRRHAQRTSPRGAAAVDVESARAERR